MPITTKDLILSKPFDCLILVDPKINVLDSKADEIEKHGLIHINISKELSKCLMIVPAIDRTRITQKWLIETLSAFHNGPLLCSRPDLLFDPSLKIDPFSLFRQAARIGKLIVMWPGEFLDGTLSYATPEHHHYQTWNIRPSLLHNPHVIIHPISNDQGE